MASYPRRPLQDRTVAPPPPYPGHGVKTSRPASYPAASSATKPSAPTSPAKRPNRASTSPPALPWLPDDTLAEIFTHRTISSSRNYERLEGIGDRVAALAAVDLLQYREPEVTPCVMSRFQDHFCSNATFSRAALRCGFRPRIASVNQPTLKVLADVFEAAVGAVFLEHGYGEAADWFEAVMEHDYDWALESARGYANEHVQHQPARTEAPGREERDENVYVQQDRLEALARRYGKRIEYELLVDGRLARRGRWKVAVYDNVGRLATGLGWTEGEAYEDAAAKGLEQLGR